MTGDRLLVTAKNFGFDRTCLAAPAGRAFTIAFTNDDAGTGHNVAVYRAGSPVGGDEQTVFSGDVVTGVETVTYRVHALAAGNYFFHCTVHPTTMYGRFVVGP